MEEGRALFDASAYMLLEASGDSEEEYLNDVALEVDSGAAAAADDALSCSYGSLISDKDVDAVNVDVDFHGKDFGDECCIRRKEEIDGGDSEEEDGVVDQCCGGGTVAPPAEACEESNVNKMETDKLFWESCLAS